MIDTSPLYKYLISGPDATRLLDRVITRDASAIRVDQVIYTPWCDDDGKVLDDGTDHPARRAGVPDHRRRPLLPLVPA